MPPIKWGDYREGLTTRAGNALRAAGFDSLDHVKKDRIDTINRLIWQHGVGRSTINEILKWAGLPVIVVPPIIRCERCGRLIK